MLSFRRRPDTFEGALPRHRGPLEWRLHGRTVRSRATACDVSDQAVGGPTP
jgi:hypothetical protein